MIQELVITPFHCPECPVLKILIFGFMLGAFVTFWGAMTIHTIMLARMEKEPEEDAGNGI